MNKFRRFNIGSVLFLCVSVVNCLSAFAFPIASPGTEGFDVIVNSISPVVATYQGNSAAYSDDLYLMLDSHGNPGNDGNPTNDKFIFNNHASHVGATEDLGSFPLGTKLIFRLHINNTGYDFFSGPANLNPDSHSHARVQSNWQQNESLVSFEDLFDGPFNYNDLSFSFTNVQSTSSNPLPVLFKKQTPPGDDDNTLNCGQTSALMVMCYHKGETPTEQGIKDIDDWLFKKYPTKHPIRGYNGSYSNTTELTTLVKEYGGFTNSYSGSGWSLTEIKNKIDEGIPVIAAVEAGKLISKLYLYKWAGGHFVVVTGYTDTHIICNDPGTWQGKDIKYSNIEFANAFSSPSQGSSVVIVVPTSTVTKPVAPSNMSASSQSSSSINLTWADNSSNETGFYLHRWSWTESAWSNIATLGANTTTYTDSGLSADTTYCYAVESYNSAGGSWLTEVYVCATTPTQGRVCYSGTLTDGQYEIQPDGMCYLSTASGTHTGVLYGPYGTDFDLNLYRWEGYSWANVASGTTSSNDEIVSYMGSGSTYYFWAVKSFHGTGNYSLCITHP